MFLRHTLPKLETLPNDMTKHAVFFFKKSGHAFRRDFLRGGGNLVQVEQENPTAKKSTALVLTNMGKRKKTTNANRAIGIATHNTSTMHKWLFLFSRYFSGRSVIIFCWRGGGSLKFQEILGSFFLCHCRRKYQTTKLEPIRPIYHFENN